MNNPLIAHANTKRLETIKELERALRYGQSTRTSVEQLRQVAPSPRSLGFSEDDLRYYLSGIDRRKKSAVWKLKKLNQRADRNNGRLSKRESAEKRNLNHRLSIFGKMTDLIKAEIRRREDERTVQPEPKTVAKLEPETVAPEKVLKYKAEKSNREKRSSKKSAVKQPRTETTLDSFSQLEEYMAFQNRYASPALI